MAWGGKAVSVGEDVVFYFCVIVVEVGGISMVFGVGIIVIVVME